MPVTIHGKEYKTVAERMSDLHGADDSWSLTSELIHVSDDEVIVKSSLTFENRRTFEGIAHEHKGASYINKTSYVEVAQTSAWGRALACAGLAGTELASADEMVNSLRNQKK